MFSVGWREPFSWGQTNSINFNTPVNITDTTWLYSFSWQNILINLDMNDFCPHLRVIKTDWTSCSHSWVFPAFHCERVPVLKSKFLVTFLNFPINYCFFSIDNCEYISMDVLDFLRLNWKETEKSIISEQVNIECRST